jgi:hypothetical protein
MALLEQEIVLEELPESGGYDLIPAGWYTATITETDVKDTKDGRGKYVKIRCDVTGPTHQGRVVFGNLNIQNPSAEAERIGRQQFGDLLRSLGMDRIQDTDQLVGGNVQVKVGIRKDKTGQYEDQNDIRGFKALESGGTIIQQAPKAAKPATAPAVKAATPPWKK